MDRGVFCLGHATERQLADIVVIRPANLRFDWGAINDFATVIHW